LAAYRRAFDRHQDIIDDGRWAALNGYDVIEVEMFQYRVILNRSKIAVQEGGVRL
jgi:hypothetical protein